MTFCFPRDVECGPRLRSPQRLFCFHAAESSLLGLRPLGGFTPLGLRVWLGLESAGKPRAQAQGFQV